MTEEGKNFKWRLFFSGLFDFKNAAKAFVLGFWMIVLITIVASMAWGGLSLYKMFKPVPLTPDVTTVAEGGTANIDKSTVNVNTTNMPLSTLLNFGSHGKTNNKE